MIIRLDDNKYPINETRKVTPLQATATVSIPTSSTDSAKVVIPSDEMWFIKSWTITKGADVTVSSITIDNTDTYETASVADTVSRYGEALNAEKNVTISGSNAGLASESLEIQVDGYKIVF
jgi:uncharacterized Zn finger protein